MIRNRAPFSEARVPGRSGLRALVLLVAAAAGGAFAPDGMRAQEAPDDTPAQGRIAGIVTDVETGTPLAAAQVRVRDIGRSDLSHADGSFHLERIPEGTHVLLVERLGYATHEEEVEVRSGQETEVRVALQPTAIQLGGIVVTGVGRERGVHETYQPTSVLRDEELARRLTSTLAGTISHEAGISMRSFGSAPAQPVIRGLTDDRVLILEDGHRTGDMSTTGADHAVGIDPVTAGRIEIVRGPAGLMYGSSALGGVINVIREEVPRSLPERAEGMVSAQGESVNMGITGAARVAVPLADRFAVRGELSARRTGDTRTPLGELGGTDARGYNGAFGASWLPGWGFAGVAFRDYLLDYGVPGEFQGEQLPGAHRGGAELETRRRVGRIEMGHFAGLGPFAVLEAQANVVHYTHAEFEPLGDGSRRRGTTFDQLTSTLDLSARHEHDNGRLRQEGALGLFAMHQDLLASDPRDSKAWNLAGFGYEEVDLGAFRVQAGVRYDWHRVEPTDPEAAPELRTRSFGDFSGSLAALWEPREGLIAGASLARAFRSPSPQELFSDGPHLADFSYDIGNPELGSEVGLGTDLFVRVNRARLSAEVTVFRNGISNFIHYAPTDRQRLGVPVFEARGADAVFLGADGSVQWEVVPELVLDGTVSYVRAEYSESGEPLPAIPPLNGSLSVRYEPADYFLTAGWDGAASQDRVPDPIDVGGGQEELPEEPTDGYGLVEVGAGYRWVGADRTHSVTLTVHNALDTEWRNHLSRAKEVAPEPGRNVQLLYRVSF